MVEMPTIRSRSVGAICRPEISAKRLDLPTQTTHSIWNLMSTRGRPVRGIYSPKIAAQRLDLQTQTTHSNLDSHEHLADGSTTPKKGEESAMRIIKPSQSSLDKKTSTEDLSDLTDPGDRATKDPEKSVDHQQPEASRTATYSDVVPDDFNYLQVTCHVLRAFLYLFKNWREPLAFCILFYILYLVPLMKRAGIY
ncbi:hypothetical protein PSHT_02673 [Puccinia striiformis]|uniref:Uncharacterized protein n=1 Tax=Puccinia striiformis TaxID=27350 RepID=A0A2S4WHK7_9BASI|nr:hypothetical protein PSHT_02673 [Puccinia striiformis]